MPAKNQQKSNIVWWKQVVTWRLLASERKKRANVSFCVARSRVSWKNQSRQLAEGSRWKIQRDAGCLATWCIREGKKQRNKRTDVEIFSRFLPLSQSAAAVRLPKRAFSSPLFSLLSPNFVRSFAPNACVHVIENFQARARKKCRLKSARTPSEVDNCIRRSSRTRD